MNQLLTCIDICGDNNIEQIEQEKTIAYQLDDLFSGIDEIQGAREPNFSKLLNNLGEKYRWSDGDKSDFEKAANNYAKSRWSSQQNSSQRGLLPVQQPIANPTVPAELTREQIQAQRIAKLSSNQQVSIVSIDDMTIDDLKALSKEELARRTNELNNYYNHQKSQMMSSKDQEKFNFIKDYLKIKD